MNSSDVRVVGALIAAVAGLVAATIQAPLPWVVQISIVVITLLVAIISGWVLLSMLRRRVTPEARKRITLPVIVICIIISALGLLIYYRFTLPEVKITYPTNGSQVNSREDISGEARNIPNNNLVWIFVYSYPGNFYYPHSSGALISNSSFTSPNIIIGDSQDVGQNFIIIACLVDDNGRAVIQQYLGNPSRSGITLPPTKVCDLITVTRRR